jgi:hypothetical protein
MLTGESKSNCLDGERDLDGYILKGISGRSEIGFLTISEHYQ